MPTDDRDRQLDRALARRLSDSRDAACPDAEILAAYHERTLSLEEMAEWKEHIASCSRCQEALALVEESEKALAEDGKELEVEGYLGAAEPLTLPEAQAALPRDSRNLWLGRATPQAAGGRPAERTPRLNWRWVAPVGALAAAVIVWIGVRDIEVANKAAKQSVEMAQNRTAPPAAVSPALVAPRAEIAPRPRNRNPEPTVREPHKEEQAAGGAPQVLRQSEQERPLERQDRDLEAAKPGVNESRAIVAPSEAKKSRAAGAAPAPSPPVRNGLEANKPAASDKLEPVPPEATQSLEMTAAAPTLNTSQSDLQMMRLAAEDHRVIVAPGQKHVWRVGEGGSIARSSDGGKTWKKQNSGVTVDLTSGSATSEKVAWVAGRSGTLLLTTDGGKHWKQIPTPITGDLGGVHALDQAHASIWEASNRKSFLTSDGGETWTPAANE